MGSNNVIERTGCSLRESFLVNTLSQTQTPISEKLSEVLGKYVPLIENDLRSLSISSSLRTASWVSVLDCLVP